MFTHVANLSQWTRSKVTTKTGKQHSKNLLPHVDFELALAH